MKNSLLLLPIINQIVLMLIPIKDFFINPIFNNKFMEYFIKWITVVSYGVAYITCMISIYFLAIAVINKLNEETVKSAKKNKIGIVMFLISFTATALSAGLIIIF